MCTKGCRYVPSTIFIHTSILNNHVIAVYVVCMYVHACDVMRVRPGT